MKKLILLLTVLIVSILFQPLITAGALGESVYTSQQEINSDLIAANTKVINSAKVNGDILFAGDTVRNGGHVAGDFLGLGCFIYHEGQTDGSARFCGLDVVINGIINKNATIFGYGQRYDSNSIIRGNLYAVGSDITITGKIQGTAVIQADNVTIGGDIGKDVEIYANSLTILPRANFNGPVTYFGPKAATIMPAAKFNHSELKFSKVSNLNSWHSPLFRLGIVVFLAIVLAGFLPKIMLKTKKQLLSSPGQNCMYGTILVLIVLISVLALYWLGLGLLPIAILLVVSGILTVVLCLLAQVLAGAIVGSFLWIKLTTKFSIPSINPNISVFLQTVVGSILVGLACQIPYLGALICVALMFYCSGFLLAALFTDSRWKTQLQLANEPKRFKLI